MPRAVLILPAVALAGCCNLRLPHLEMAAMATLCTRPTIRLGACAGADGPPFAWPIAIGHELSLDPASLGYQPNPGWVTLVEFGAPSGLGLGLKIQAPLPGALATRYGSIRLMHGSIGLLTPAWGPTSWWASSPAQPVVDDAWSAPFVRTSGWTGADGAATVALPGERCLWLFGDTWIGPIVEGRHAPGSAMVNNTIAVHRRLDACPGTPPRANAVEFLWHAGQPPGAWAIPTQRGEWFWPAGGGIVAPGADGRNRLLILFTRLARRDASDSIWNFAARGTSLVVVPNPRDEPARWRQEQHTLTTLAGGRGVLWGAAAVRASDPDDLLIYGIDSTDTLNRSLLLARAPAATAEHFETWTFRSAAGWSRAPSDAAPVAMNVPSELSVHRVAGLDRYVMIHSEPPLGARILARTALAPEGPWSEPVVLYACPEPAADTRRFVYAAKGHPELSAPGQLLISYCVNSTEFADVAAHAEVYRPRFVRVPTSLLLGASVVRRHDGS